MNLLQYLLLGGTAFRDVRTLLQDLGWDEASHVHDGLPYTLADVIAHLAMTQRTSLDLTSGRRESWPEDQPVWPVSALNEADFKAHLIELELGLLQAQALAQDPSGRAREILMDLAAHSAYHWGQVALLRRLGGKLPEPAHQD
ncbi:hypothetical protein GCM10008955_28450 [Deinococcus malanensis]|uniref:Damage-inducible protein DinB n=1 Tax=Deinococcus malanensis TaxID=1706855 RepID=A0ABQ2EYG0_9DEIO|nr:damage-inducible protein DinB [Deinococcus malanensis]GGK32793.1 hypothetical protein GCM10008955_28450 [Deinococcus malanensis]